MSESIIGLVPAAGKGTRLAPFPCPKELFPIGYQDYTLPGRVEKRPKVISQYLIENILLAGVKRVLVVLGPGKHDIMSYYGDGSRHGCEIAYLFQERLNGMPGALDLAYAWAGDATILFGMPDTMIEPKDAFKKMLADHHGSGADVTLGVFPTDNPQKFGMVEFNDSGEVLSTIDKPKSTHLTYMWGCACWSAGFSRLMHGYLIRNAHCEKEIVLGDVFNEALKLKLKVRAYPFPEGLYMDIGTAAELDSTLKKFHL